ncbi:restriction endonuclease [Coraliomargarita sp. SDUM461004]|uniref:Restriction endonuclease n=1 Tax=Thalassobacterium sedimentorum TaxID=3041258 RepID=A0ABU1AN97_9BACT|nr:restriction endonuclease [Coraliomargarita sp. SDUM461004]MDQ8196273.1 restriction endonuclease [Coraliomargarita sp. SDUM461004]
MKRNNDSLANSLIMAPWWVSVILGILVYSGLKFVAPGLGGENMIFKPIAQAVPQLAPYAGVFFAMLAVFSYIFGRKQAALVDKQQSLDSLCAVSWKEFEWLVGEVFRRQGYRTEESLGGGADGGIDLILHRDGQTTLVQCKRWKSKAVGVPIVREIFGILTAENADRAIVITTSKFTKESENFAAKKPIELIDGHRLLELVKSVQTQRTEAPQVQKAAPEQVSTPDSCAIPQCPKCNSTMVRRTARRGANAGNAFWGCTDYPKCRSVISIES